uniref:Uncharacterized protein n=1 Tax=Odontella aurita TaxID=265563 RepID=A0A7S4HVS2_9STRA|mmetsp:Transcript_16040/g.46161  ORF Transcript_16040/g.46161 Transcript_16040/m.46161 type:complete len:539 (+) Transcript_16040:55-1671(+)
MSDQAQSHWLGKKNIAARESPGAAIGSSTLPKGPELIAPSDRLPVQSAATTIDKAGPNADAKKRRKNDDVIDDPRDSKDSAHGSRALLPDGPELAPVGDRLPAQLAAHHDFGSKGGEIKAQRETGTSKPDPTVRHASGIDDRHFVGATLVAGVGVCRPAWDSTPALNVAANADNSDRSNDNNDAGRASSDENGAIPAFTVTNATAARRVEIQQGSSASTERERERERAMVLRRLMDDAPVVDGEVLESDKKGQNDSNGRGDESSESSSPCGGRWWRRRWYVVVTALSLVAVLGMAIALAVTLGSSSSRDAADDERRTPSENIAIEDEKESSPSGSEPMGTGGESPSETSMAISSRPSSAPTLVGRNASIELALRDAVYGGDEPSSWRDPSSPQSRALSWIVAEDGLALDPARVSGRRLAQRYALAALFFATNGRTWIEGHKFLTDAHECRWWSSQLFEGYDYVEGSGVFCSAHPDEIDYIILGEYTSSLDTSFSAVLLYSCHTRSNFTCLIEAYAKINTVGIAYDIYFLKRSSICLLI